MCFDPVSAALVGGGGVAQGAASYLQAKNARANEQRAIDARARERAAETVRQQGFQQENAKTFADTLGIYEPGTQGASLAGAVAAREKAFADNLPKPSEQPTSSTTPNIVKTDRERANKRTADYLAQQGGARAAIEGLGDQFGANQRGVAGGARQIGTVNNFARSSAGINPAEQAAAAAKSQKPPSTLAELLGLAGTGAQLGGFLGLGQKMPFGVSPFAPLAGYQQGGGK